MSVAAPERALTVPRWMPAVATGLGVLGLAMAVYLTYEHLNNGASFACPGTGSIDCVKVTTSEYADLFGIPVAYLGLAFFVGLIPFLLPWAWREGPRWPALLRFGMLGLGVVMVLYLIWAEFFQIGAICLWCTGVHAVTVVLFALVAFAEALREPV